MFVSFSLLWKYINFYSWNIAQLLHEMVDVYKMTDMYDWDLYDMSVCMTNECMYDKHIATTYRTGI